MREANLKNIDFNYSYDVKVAEHLLLKIPEDLEVKSLKIIGEEP